MIYKNCALFKKSLSAVALSFTFQSPYTLAMDNQPPEQPKTITADRMIMQEQNRAYALSLFTDCKNDFEIFQKTLRNSLSRGAFKDLNILYIKIKNLETTISLDSQRLEHVGGENKNLRNKIVENQESLKILSQQKDELLANPEFMLTINDIKSKFNHQAHLLQDAYQGLIMHGITHEDISIVISNLQNELNDICGILNTSVYSVNGEKNGTALSNPLLPIGCLQKAISGNDLNAKINGWTLCLSQYSMNDFPRDIHQIIFSDLATKADLIDFEKLAGTCKYWHTFVHEKIKGAVLVLGPTGSGKSTLVHLLAGKQLIAKEPNIWGDHRLIAKEPIPNINIWNKASAGTLDVSKVLDFSNLRMIYDCPAFNDPRGKDQDFINSLAIHDALKGNIKIILVVSDTALRTGRGQDFARLINKMTEIFPNQDQLKSLLSLVVGHQEKNTVSYFQKFVRGVYPLYLTKRGADLLNYLASNPSKVVDFSTPKKEGIYEVSESLQSLLDNKEYVCNPQVSEPVKEAVMSKWERWSSLSRDDNEYVNKSSY